MTSVRVLRTSAMGFGRSTLSEVVRPPRKRTCMAIFSALMSVMSSISSATIRLRSRGCVRGLFQTRGKSAESARMRVRASSLSSPFIGFALLVVVLLERVEATKMFVPVGFKRVGDQTIVWIDLKVAATGKLGLIASPFELRAAQRIGLCDHSAAAMVPG
jgi:hypothetical protein